MRRLSVEIQQLDRGYFIQAGCKQIATSLSLDEVLNEIRGYFTEPDLMHAKYFPEDFTPVEKSNDCRGAATEVARSIPQSLASPIARNR